MKCFDRKTNALMLCAVTALICGCASQPPVPQKSRGSAKYLPDGEVFTGQASEVTLYDLESATQELLSNMRKSNLFAKNYSAVVAEKGGALPVIVIGNIENRTTTRLQTRLDMLKSAINASLLETGLFEVKDDGALPPMLGRIIAGADAGIERSDLLASIGDQDPPDLMMLADVSESSEAVGYHTYKLRIAVHNLKTGKIVWQGIQTRVKF